MEKGRKPDNFVAAHGRTIDATGSSGLWIARTNGSFDTDMLIREWKYAGVPCGLSIWDQYIYMFTEVAGQLLQRDLDGKVLATTGNPGNGIGEGGEVHLVTVTPKGEIYVAGRVNATVQKFVRQ